MRGTAPAGFAEEVEQAMSDYKQGLFGSLSY
jgi:hypothetical protein